MSLPNTPPALSVAHDILSDMYLPPLVVDYDQTGVMLDHQQQYVVMEPPQGYEHVDQTDLPLTPTTPQTPTSAQLGFAAMPTTRQRQIASQGGHAAQSQGRAHQLTDVERSRGGKSGGSTTSQDRSHMAEIGSRGGQAAQRSGHAHKLTDAERSRGGQRSRATRKRRHTEMVAEQGEPDDEALLRHINNQSHA